METDPNASAFDSGEELQPAMSDKDYDPNDQGLLTAQGQFSVQAVAKGYRPRTLRRPTEPALAPWAYRTFRRRPKHWGLRGDPWLWREARDTLGMMQQPESGERFEELLLLALHCLVGIEFNLFASENVAIDRYPMGGMSGGHVCPEKWVDALIPTLVQQFNDEHPADAVDELNP